MAVFQGDRAACARLAPALADHWPADPWARLWAAFGRGISGAREQALAELAELARIELDQADFRQLLGIAFWTLEDWGAALPEFREAARLRPGSAVNHVNLAQALTRGGEYAAAVAALEQALALDPDLANAHHDLGYLLGERLDEPERSLAHYREVIRLRPLDPSGYFNVGTALLELGELDAGAQHLGRAVELDPGDPLLRCQLAFALMHLGDHAGAAEHTREATRLQPDLALAHRDLALALEALGDLEGAEASALEAIRLDPSDPWSHYRLGAISSRRGEPARAADAMRAAIQLAPGLGPAHRGLGTVLETLGDHSGAIEAYRRAVELDPLDAGAADDLERALGREAGEGRD